jgi:hypothetical protein
VYSHAPHSCRAACIGRCTSSSRGIPRWSAPESLSPPSCVRAPPTENRVSPASGLGVDRQADSDTYPCLRRGRLSRKRATDAERETGRGIVGAARPDQSSRARTPWHTAAAGATTRPLVAWAVAPSTYVYSAAGRRGFVHR